MITYLADTGLKKQQEDKINSIIRSQALRFQRKSFQKQAELSPVRSDVTYSSSVFNLTSKSQNGFHFLSFDYTPEAGTWILCQLKEKPEYICYFGSDTEGNTYYGSLNIRDIDDEHYIVASNRESEKTTYRISIWWRDR